MVATPATVPESSNAPTATARSPLTAAEMERIMREFIDALESLGRPSDAFSQMAENLRKQEEASPLTPMIIPPQPSDLQETTTARELSSTPAAARAEDAPSISTTVIDPQPAEKTEMESEAERDAGEDVMAEENAGDDEKIVEEDDDTTGKDLDTTMAVDLNVGVDGGAGSTPDVTVTEGETHVSNSEGETPVKIAEGETPVVYGRETPATIEGGGTLLKMFLRRQPLVLLMRGKPLGKLWRGKPLMLLRSPPAVDSKRLLIW